MFEIIEILTLYLPLTYISALKIMLVSLLTDKYAVVLPLFTCDSGITR